jgi:hypothetical protein
LISNLENHPLPKDLLIDIPPNSVQFGPTNETGKILTAAICLSPYTMENHTTQVIKGPNLFCPKTCYTGEECECKVDECKSGVYLMDNFEGDPLGGDVIRDINTTEFSYEFTGFKEGTVRIRMFCYSPYETKQEAYISVIPQTITTTTLGEFQVSSVTCSADECVINVNKNTRSDAVTILIRLIKEPEGIIYYSGKFDTMPSSIGLKTALLRTVKSCPSGTELKLLTMAYSYSDLNRRVARIKGDAFIC